MKHISWKYIAGLVDGEGCLDFQIDKQYMVPRLRIALVESSRFILELILNQCGGNIWDKHRANDNPNWQNACYWQLQGGQLRKVLVELIPFLFIKKEQAKMLLWFIDNLKSKKAQMVGYENINQARQIAKEELKAMKRDPQRLTEVAVKKITDVIVQTT